MTHKTLRLLSIDLAGNGFGFALLDAKRGLLDWGFTDLLAADDKTFLGRVDSLIDRGRPTVLMFENFDSEHGRESAHKRLTILFRIAADRNLGTCQVSRKVVERVLGVRGKVNIARMLAEKYPELERRVPPDRRQWHSEDKRANIFDALSFATVVIPPHIAQ